MQASHAETLLICAFVVAVACAGCNEREEVRQTTGAAAPVQDRYARQVMPPQPGWKHESEIPEVPQAYPKMVLWEVSDYPPGSVPTPAQQRGADALRERCLAAAEAHGWFDFENGLADGYHVSVDASGERDADTHYRNDEFLLDDRVLDCDRPEYLMYYPNPDGTQKLVGLMFLARRIGEHGPQIGGPLTVWHFHVWSSEQCMEHGIIVTGDPKDGECKGGVRGTRSPEMLHVWFVDRPDGPFSTSMHLEGHLDLNGLDAPFVVREGVGTERFMAELSAVIADLDDEMRPVVSQSVSYLIFAFGKGFTEEGEQQPQTADVADPDLRGQRALLRAVERRGSSVRVRLFVGMAAELDGMQPGIWREYEAVYGEQEIYEQPEPHQH